MEALMASAILFAGVLAVITAIMGGQHKALEAHRRMDAALAGEELMWQLATLDVSDLLTLPPTMAVGPFQAQIDAETEDHNLPGLGIRVRGTLVHIRIPPTFTGDPLLVELDLFIPEPQEP